MRERVVVTSRAHSTGAALTCDICMRTKAPGGSTATGAVDVKTIWGTRVSRGKEGPWQVRQGWERRVEKRDGKIQTTTSVPCVGAAVGKAEGAICPAVPGGQLVCGPSSLVAKGAVSWQFWSNVYMKRPYQKGIFGTTPVK